LSPYSPLLLGCVGAKKGRNSTDVNIFKYIRDSSERQVAYGVVTNCMARQFQSTLGREHCFGQRRHNLEEVSDYPIVGYLEDWGVLVLVDGDDCL
jgi:hypothetical protein